MFKLPDNSNHQPRSLRRLQQLTRLRTTVRRIPWQRTAVIVCCIGVSLIMGNALGVLLSTVFGVSWLFMAKYSNQSDTSFRPWHEQGVGRRNEQAGEGVRHRQSATRSAGKRPHIRILATTITRQDWLERPVLAGVVLFGLAVWVVKVVLTEDRPGRRLLGDLIYAYWPLQPYECLLAALVSAVLGLLLIGRSAPGRRVFLQWLGHMGFDHAVSKVSNSRQTGPVVMKRDESEASPASSTASATSSAQATVPSTTPAFVDHHGI